MTCGEKLQLVSRTIEPDHLVALNEDGSPIFIKGKRNEVWRTCGKRKGHRGKHGPGFLTKLRYWLHGGPIPSAWRAWWHPYD